MRLDDSVAFTGYVLRRIDFAFARKNKIGLPLLYYGDLRCFAEGVEPMRRQTVNRQ